MPSAYEDPTVGYFSLELDTCKVEVVHELSGLRWSIPPQTCESVNSMGRVIEVKIPGPAATQSEITFKTYDTSMALVTWFEAVEKTPKPGNGAVTVYDPLGKPLGRYTLTGVWPSKLSWSTISANGNEPMALDVTLQVDLITLA